MLQLRVPGEDATIDNDGSARVLSKEFGSSLQHFVDNQVVLLRSEGDAFRPKHFVTHNILVENDTLRFSSESASERGFSGAGKAGENYEHLRIVRFTN